MMLATKSLIRPIGVGKMMSNFDISKLQKSGKGIYLDYAATTPLDFRVLDKMMPYMMDKFGNAHSR